MDTGEVPSKTIELISLIPVSSDVKANVEEEIGGSDGEPINDLLAGLGTKHRKMQKESKRKGQEETKGSGYLIHWE